MLNDIINIYISSLKILFYFKYISQLLDKIIIVRSNIMKNLYVFGTVVNINFIGSDEVTKEIIKLLYEIDDKCSLYKEDSDINKINNNSGKYVIVDKIVYNLIKKSIYYSDITCGDMDISTMVVDKKHLNL